MLQALMATGNAHRDATSLADCRNHRCVLDLRCDGELPRHGQKDCNCCGGLISDRGHTFRVQFCWVYRMTALS